MQQAWWFVVGLGLVLAACGGPRSSPAPESGEVVIERLRLAASEEARTHFSYFLERQTAGAPDETDFEVIIRMPPESEREPAVVTLREVVEHEAGQFAGRIAGPVAGYPEFGEGARVTFPRDIVADWSFRRGASTVGNFTFRHFACLMGNAGDRAQKAAAIGGRKGDAAQRAMIEAFSKLDDDTVDGMRSLCEPFSPSPGAP